MYVCSSTYSSDESPASSPGPETGTAEFLSPRSWFYTSAKTSDYGHQSAALTTGETSGSARQSSAMATEKSSNRRDFSPVRGWTEGWMKVLPAYGQDTAAAGIGESYLWSRIGRGGLLSALGNWRVWGNKDELPNGGDRATSTSTSTEKQAKMETSSETVVKTAVSQTSSSAVITSQSADSAMSGDQYDDVAPGKGFAESEDHLQEGEDEVKQMGVTVQTWNQTTSTQNTDTMEQRSGQSVTQHREVGENVILAASGKDTTTTATGGDTLSVSVNLVGEQGEEEVEGEQKDEGYKTEEELEEKMVVREDGVEVTEEMQANVTDESTTVTSVETSETTDVSMTIISESLEQDKQIKTTYLEEEIGEKVEEDYEEGVMSQVTLETMQKEETVADELVDVSQTSVSESFDHTVQAMVITIEKEKTGCEEAEEGHDEEAGVGREVTVAEQEDTAEDGLAEGVMTVISTESTTTILTENHASQDTNVSVISTMSGVSDEQEKEAYSTAEEQQHGDEISKEINLEEGDTVQEVEVEETDEIINEAARKRRRTYSGGLMSYILPDEEEEEMEVETSSEEESTETSEESSMETTTGQTETIIARVQEASSESMEVEISTQGDAESSQTGQGETIIARVQEASPKSMEVEMSSQTVTSEMIVITSTVQENGEVQEDVIATSSDVEIVGEASQVLTSAKEEYVTTEASEATNEVTDFKEAEETLDETAAVGGSVVTGSSTVETTGASTHTKVVESATVTSEDIIDESQEQQSTKTIRRARATTSRRSYFLRSKLTPREAKLRASKALEPVTTGQGGKKGEETNTRKRQRVQEDSNSTTSAEHKKQKTVIEKASGASVATDVSLVLTRVDEHSDEKNGLHGDVNAVSETMEGTVTVSETDPQDEQENDEEEKDESASASSEVQTLTDLEVTNVTENAKETVTDKSVTVVSARVIAETPSKADYWFRSRRKRRLFDADDGYTISHTSAAQKHSMREEHKKSSKSVEETDDLSLKKAEQRKKEVKSSEKRTKGRPRKKRRSSVKEVDEDNKEDVLALDEASTVVTAAVTESKAQDEVQKDTPVNKSNEKMATKSKTAKKTEGASKDVDGQKRAYWLRGRKAAREPKAVVPPAGHADSMETVTEARQNNTGGSLKKKQYFILASTKSFTSRSVTTTATGIEKTIIADTSTGHDAEQDIQKQVETSTAVIENQEECATKKEDELSAGISVESQAVTMIEEAVGDEKEDMQTKTSLETIDEEVEVQVEVSTVTTEEGHTEDEQTSVAEVQEEQEEIVEGEAGEDDKETEVKGQEENAEEDEEEVVEEEEDDQVLQEVVVEGVRERTEQDQIEKQEEAEVEEKESTEEEGEGKEQTRRQGRRGNYSLRSRTVYYGSGPSARAGFLAAIATTSLSLSSSTTHVHEDDPQEDTDKVDDGDVMEQEQDESHYEEPKDKENEEERREQQQVEELAEDKEARDLSERAEESGKADEEDAMWQQEQDERQEEELKDEEKREEEEQQVEKEQTPAVEEEETKVEIQDQDASQENEEAEEELTERIDEEEGEQEIQLNKQDEEVEALAEEETQKEADEEKAGQLEVEHMQVPAEEAAVVEMEVTGQDECEEEELKDKEKTEGVEEEIQLEKEQTPAVEEEAVAEIQGEDQDVGQEKEESGEEENEAIEEEEGEEEDEGEGEESEQKHAETRRQGRRGNYWLRSKTVYYGSGPSARSGFLTAIATTAMSSGAKDSSKRTTMTSIEEVATTQIIEGDLGDESEEMDEDAMGQEQDKNQGDKPSDEVVDADEEDEEEKEEGSVRMDRGEAEIEEDARQEEEGVKEIQLSEQVPAEEEAVVVVEVKVAEQDERQEEEPKDEEKAAEVEEIQVEKEQTPAVEKEEAEIQGEDQQTEEREESEGEEETETIEGGVVEEVEDDGTEQKRDKTRRHGRRGNYWLRSKTVYYGSGPSARSGFLTAIATTAMSSGAKDSSKRTAMTSIEETATTQIIEDDLDDKSEELDEEVMGQEQDENQRDKPSEEVMEADEEKKEEEEEEIQVEKEQTSVIEEDEVKDQGQDQDTSQKKDDSEEKEKEEIEEEEGGEDEEEEDELEEGEEEVMGLGKEENQEKKSSEIIKEADEEDEEEEEESVNMDREEDERQEEEGEKEIQLNEQVSDEDVVEIEVAGQDKKEEPDEEEAQAVEEEGEDEGEKYEGRKEVSRSAGRRGNYNLRSRAVYYGSGPSVRGGFLAAIACTSMSSGKSQTKTAGAEFKGRVQGDLGQIRKKTTEETTTLSDEDDLEDESGIVDHDGEVERVGNITVVSEPHETELQTTTTYFITKITEGEKMSVDVDTDTTSLTRTTVSTVTTTTETSTDDNTMLQDVTSTAGGQTVIISEVSEEHADSMISGAAAVVTHDKSESDGDDSDDEEISDDAGGEQVSEDSMVTNVTSTTETDVAPIVEIDTTASSEETEQSQEPMETTETIEESLIAMAVEDDRMQRESEAKKGQVTMAEVESDTEQEAETSDKVTESEEDTIEEGETVARRRKGGSRGNYSLRSRTVYYGSGPSARGGFRAAMAVTAIREAGTDRSITSKAKAVLLKKAKKTDVNQASSTSSENSEDSYVVDQEAAVMETSSFEEESSKVIQESSVEDTVTVESFDDQTVGQQTDGTLAESEGKDANTSDTEVDTGLDVEQKTDQTSEDDSNGQETLQTSKVADVSQVEAVELPPVSTNASKKRKLEESSVEERPTKGERSQKGPRGNYSLRSRTVYYGSGPSARGGFLAAIATATMSSKQGQSVTSRSAKKSSRVVKSVDDTGEIEQAEEDSVITIQDDEIDDSDIVHKAGVETVETSSSTKFQEGEEEAGTVSTTIVEGITDEDIEGVLEELSESAASGQMSLEDAMAEAASPKDILSENQEESGNVTEVEQNTVHAALSDKEAVSAPPKEETSTLETDDIAKEENDEEINIMSSSTSKRSRKKRKIDDTETVELSEVISTDVEEQTASTADEEESGEMSMKTNTAVESRESGGRSYWLRKRTITYETKAPEVSVMESSTVYEADNNKSSEESNNKATKRAAKAAQVVPVASKKSRKEATVVQTEGESGSPSASIAGMSDVLEESVTSESQTTTEHAMSGTTSVKVTSSEDSLRQKTGTMVTEEGETAMLVYESGTASTSTETTVVTNVEVHSEGICDDTGTPEEAMTTTTKTTTSTTGSRTKRGPKTVTKLSILEELSEGSQDDQHDEKTREAISASRTEEAMVSSTSTSTADQGVKHCYS
ncbi:PREDICTED: nucleoprotein TPR-like [Branchiostoma belcheri]|uniref:Nucleoprotein TPR-like n=1 Tax=Branchiostoma belcheri TaxID=7741 RepID=A0A6P5A220_BRABE|nr:PREDICTED: nucleoprotein TPR-like [Branchiostoma belcheri]